MNVVPAVLPTTLALGPKLNAVRLPPPPTTVSPLAALPAKVSAPAPPVTESLAPPQTVVRLLPQGRVDEDRRGAAPDNLVALPAFDEGRGAAAAGQRGLAAAAVAVVDERRPGCAADDARVRAEIERVQVPGAADNHQAGRRIARHLERTGAAGHRVARPAPHGCRAAPADDRLRPGEAVDQVGAGTTDDRVADPADHCLRTPAERD